MASFDDVNIFGPPAPLPDMGYGLEPMEPTPAMNRRDIVANYLQKIGYEPRRAYQMAEKMVGTGELVGEFLPGTSKALAEERDDVWGERLSYLDLIPGAPLATVPIKKVVKESVKRKGIASLEQTKKMIEADVDEYARIMKAFVDGVIDYKTLSQKSVINWQNTCTPRIIGKKYIKILDSLV